MLDRNQKDKSIKGIFMTNAISYLGCNILYQLLSKTKSTVYLLVEALSKEIGFITLKEKFTNVTGINLEYYLDRIQVINGQLQALNFSMSETELRNLADSIDCVLHVGINPRLDPINDKMEIAILKNLINLTDRTSKRIFHYVSLPMQSLSNPVYTFNRQLYNQKIEHEINHYRDDGINVRIYRISEPLFHSELTTIAEDIERLPFFNNLALMLNIGVMPKELADVTFAAVDSTAAAIVELICYQGQEKGEVFHVYPEFKTNLFELIAARLDINLIQVNLDEYITALGRYLDKKSHVSTSESYHPLYEALKNQAAEIVNSQNQKDALNMKTNQTLNKLGFTWDKVTTKMLTGLIKEASKHSDPVLEQERIFIFLDYMTQVVPAIFFWFDTNGNLIGFNNKASQTIGFTLPPHHTDDHLQQLEQGERAEEAFKEDIQQVLANQQNIQKEYAFKSPASKQTKHFSVTLSPLRIGNGQIIGLLGTAIDITVKQAADLSNTKLLALTPEYKGSSENCGIFSKDVNDIIFNIQANAIELVKKKIHNSVEKKVDTLECNLNMDNLNPYIYGHYGNRKPSTTKLGNKGKK